MSLGNSKPQSRWGRVWPHRKPAQIPGQPRLSHRRQAVYICFSPVKWGKLRFLPNHLFPGSNALSIAGGTEFPFLTFFMSVEVLSYLRLYPACPMGSTCSLGGVSTLFREQVSDLSRGAHVPVPAAENKGSAAGPGFLPSPQPCPGPFGGTCPGPQRRSGFSSGLLIPGWVTAVFVNPIPAFSIFQNSSHFLVPQQQMFSFSQHDYQFILFVHLKKKTF